LYSFGNYGDGLGYWYPFLPKFDSCFIQSLLATRSSVPDGIIPGGWFPDNPQSVLSPGLEIKGTSSFQASHMVVFHHMFVSLKIKRCTRKKAIGQRNGETVLRKCGLSTQRLRTRQLPNIALALLARLIFPRPRQSVVKPSGSAVVAVTINSKTSFKRKFKSW